MQNKNSFKLVMTGGHAATTAAAVVQEIQERELQSKLKDRNKLENWKLYWIGSKYALEGSQTQSLEYSVLPSLGVEFINIRTGRLQRKFTRYTILSLVRIPLGFIDSYKQLKNIRPNAILSFGGYAAFPVVVWGKLMGIPVILHEQTIAAGRSNKMSAPFADVVTLARPESKVFFPNKKTKLVGNPLMKNILKVKPKLKIGQPPCLFIAGGSRGAQPINNLIEPVINKLLKDFVIIHLTGKLDFERFRKFKDKIPQNYKKRYNVHDMIDPALIHEAYKSADIIVSRSGANTIAEILTVKRPAILIPLPFSYLEEQKKNAILAQKFGIAKLLEQENATPEMLFELLMETKRDWLTIVNKSKDKISPDINAAKDLVDVVAYTGKLK